MPNGKLRQTRELLNRLFNSADSERWELQLLADEVGMGKTFVALAVAYSVLEAMDGKYPDLQSRRLLPKDPNRYAAQWSTFQQMESRGQ